MSQQSNLKFLQCNFHFLQFSPVHNIISRHSHSFMLLAAQCSGCMDVIKHFTQYEMQDHTCYFRVSGNGSHVLFQIGVRKDFCFYYNDSTSYLRLQQIVQLGLLLHWIQERFHSWYISLQTCYTVVLLSNFSRTSNRASYHTFIDIISYLTFIWLYNGISKMFCSKPKKAMLFSCSMNHIIQSNKPQKNKTLTFVF